MSWRDRYQPGSFRGVSFATQRHELQGGRRVDLHEFPGRDEPLAEDLGRRARQFQIECFVWGDDYYTERDALIDALEASGPATLVHPWHGSRYVSVLDFSLVETTDEGGFANFQISFGEAGTAPSQSVTPDYTAAARTTAKTALSAAPSTFARRFDLSAVPAFIETAASDLVGGFSTVAQVSAGLSGGAGATLRAFDAGLRLLHADGLLRTPLALGQALVGLVSAIGVLGARPRGRIAALTAMAAYGMTVEPVPGSTPARNQQRTNQEAIVALVRTAAAAELVRAIADTDFGSYEEAVAARDTNADLFDSWALQAADAGDDDRASTFDMLRLAMVRDVTTRGGTLSRLYAYRMGTTEPSIVVAQRLYGPVADLTSRDADIVARNAVRHPGFVPGGADIRVVANG